MQTLIMLPIIFVYEFLKYKLFLSETVAVNKRFFKRHIGNDPICPRCGHAEEIINHMNFTCSPAIQCWALSTVPSTPRIFPSENLYTNINYLLARTNVGRNIEELTRVFPWITGIYGKHKMKNSIMGEISHQWIQQI